MKLWIDNKYIGPLGQKTEAEAAIANWQKENPERLLYLITINGIERNFTDEWPLTLEDTLNTNQCIYLSSQTKSGLILELAGSTQEYLSRLVKGMGPLAADFYADPDTKAWTRLADFLGGLEYLSQSLIKLQIQTFDYGAFQTMLGEMLSAIEFKDSITIADLLMYEWQEWLRSMLQEMKNQ